MHRVQSLLLALVIICRLQTIVAIVGGRWAKVPPYNDPAVFVNHVGRFSRVEGFYNPTTQLYTFRGIRYADPSIRENRFLRPKLKRLVGNVDARRNAPPCPQPDFYDERKIVGNEDCLALNIFTPQMPDESTGLPVILFIHGGGYRYGSAAQYGAEPIIQEAVIFVPIQYRLGTLGILGDGSKEFGGNVALFDMNAALQWVSEYIGFFGGDKKRIKVMGHGSGASSAMFLSTSPMSRSAISGVISMSGSSLNQDSYDTHAKNTTLGIANAHGCPHRNEVELVKCLQAKSTEEIIEKDSDLQIERLQEQNMIKAMSGMVSFSPNVETENDNRGLPGIIVEKPEDSLKKEPEKKVPLLIGTVKHETAGAIDQKDIIKVFKSTSEFLQASASTLNLNRLFNTTKIASDRLLTTLKLPSLKDYLTIPDGLSPDKILLKLIEATTDIFFNIPTTLTASLWSKFSAAFFYQFEHIADGAGGGKLFLKPLPLVRKANTKGFIAHGDELSFLFDVHDIYGNRINGTELKTQRDKDARRNFIKLILQFAHLNSTSSQLSLNEEILHTFQGESTSFIRVSEKMSFDTNFRFCQLSVLGAPFKATQKLSCEILSEHIKKLPLPGVLGGGAKKLGFV